MKNQIITAIFVVACFAALLTLFFSLLYLESSFAFFIPFLIFFVFFFYSDKQTDK